MLIYSNTMLKFTNKLAISKANMIITSYFTQFSYNGTKVLVGKPVYKVGSSKVVVQVPYYAPQGNAGIISAESKMNALGSALTFVLGQCEVQFIQLRYPYLDSKVLSQYLAINASKYGFTRLQKGVFNQVSTIVTENALPVSAMNSMTTGIKVELAGRLTTQRNIPRKTVNNAYTGSFTASDNLGSTLDFNQYTTKNKLGAYTVKV